MNCKFLKQAFGLVIGICALNSNGICSTNSSNIMNNTFMQDSQLNSNYNEEESTELFKKGVDLLKNLKFDLNNYIDNKLNNCSSKIKQCLKNKINNNIEQIITFFNRTDDDTDDYYEFDPSEIVPEY